MANGMNTRCAGLQEQLKQDMIKSCALQCYDCFSDESVFSHSLTDCWAIE